MILVRKSCGFLLGLLGRLTLCARHSVDNFVTVTEQALHSLIDACGPHVMRDDKARNDLALSSQGPTHDEPLRQCGQVLAGLSLNIIEAVGNRCFVYDEKPSRSHTTNRDAAYGSLFASLQARL